jgi:hypothetical protein
MAVKIELKRSAIPGKVPTVDQLDLGELAINTYDGAIYFKQDTGVSQSIVQVTTTGGTTISASYAVTSSHAITASYALNVPDTASFSVSSSYALTASYALNVPETASFAISSSYALTASYALNVPETASFAISSSYAISASYAVSSSNAISASYALSGSNSISASYALTASFVNPLRQNVQITGSLFISGSQNIIGSGSDVFSVDGTSGRLFEIDDTLSGSLFSVNTVSGLPIIEAFSDNTVRIGQYGTRALYVSQSAVGIGKENALNGKLDVSGSTFMTGSLNVSQGITGSLFGTASWAQNAQTASFVLNAVSASFAATASSADNFFIRQNLTASNALISGTITAQTLVVQTVTSSVIYSSGSNVFGDSLSDVQQMTGSVNITGSLSVNGGSVPLGSGVAGQVAVWSGSSSVSGSNNLFWDRTNSRLGIGTSTPGNHKVYIQHDSTGPNFYDFSSLFINGNGSNVYIKAGTNGSTAGVSSLYLGNSTGVILTISGESTNSIKFYHGTTSNFMYYQPGGYNMFRLGLTEPATSVFRQAVISSFGQAGRNVLSIYGTTSQTGTLLDIHANDADTSRVFQLNANGNLMLQNGGTFTDTGERLQVSGSAKITGNTVITGSLTVLGGITGSLFGTASWAQNAVTASFVANAISASYAATASSADSFLIRQSLTASQALISGSGTQRLTIVGSGSAQPLFTVQGSQGGLFSVTDSLSGSLFTVSDVSGLPIMEVFSDNTILMGNYQDPMLLTTTRATSTVGVNVIYNLPTASYDAVYVDYAIRSGSNARAGNFMALWSGSQVNYVDNSTTDFGNTFGFVFGASISGSNMVVTGSATTAGWTIKTIVKAI